MNLAKQEIHRLLSDRGEMCGLDMVKASRHLKRGTIYVWLDQMESDDLVSSRADERGRRIYSLTERGKLCLVDHLPGAFDAP